jgi:hypothetical protein
MLLLDAYSTTIRELESTLIKCIAMDDRNSFELFFLTKQKNPSSFDERGSFLTDSIEKTRHDIENGVLASLTSSPTEETSKG